MKNIPFIAVEGPIGVGKTSLSRFVARSFDFHHLKEIVEENPFLTKFYDNIDEWSFQTEMFFLCNRYKQLEDAKKLFLNNKKAVVSDYHIFKNTIFAKRTLQNGQYDKYMEIYKILTRDMPEPNLVIYLNASLDTLLKRIAFRGRSFEENIDQAYLKQLSEDYDIFMEQFKVQHPHIPVLSFNGDDIDFVNKPDDLNLILNEVNQLLKK